MIFCILEARNRLDKKFFVRCGLAPLHVEGRYLCDGGVSEGKLRNVLLDHLGNALVGVIFQHEVTKDRL